MLGAFDPKLQRDTESRLEKMGVQVRLETAAVGMDKDSVTVRAAGGDERFQPDEDLAARGGPRRGYDAGRGYGAGTDWASPDRGAARLQPAGHPEAFAVAHYLADQLPGVAQPPSSRASTSASDLGPAGRRLAGQAVQKP